MHTNSITYQLCGAGLQSIVLIIASIYAGRKLVKVIKDKKKAAACALVAVLMLNSYFMFTFKGAIRWTMLWCGWDVAAFKLTDEMIEVSHSEISNADKAVIRTGMTDSEGFPIKPYLTIYRIWPAYILVLEIGGG